MEQTVWMPMGERMTLPEGWSVAYWHISLFASSRTLSGVDTSSLVTLGPGTFFSGSEDLGDGNSNADYSDCPTSDFCARERASSPPNDWHRSEMTMGGVTYHGVANDFLVEWYFEQGGHVFKFMYDAMTNGELSEYHIIESADWTATRGTVVHLPTGLRVGLDLSAGWKIDGSVLLAPPAGQADDGVIIWQTTYGSIDALVAGRDVEDAEVTSEEERTVNGITYHGTAYEPAVGHSWQNWSFMLDGRAYSLGGDSSTQTAFMESVRWDKGSGFVMELDHLELFRDWLQELSDAVDGTGRSASRRSVIDYIDKYLRLEARPLTAMAKLVPLVDEMRERAKSVMTSFKTAFAESATEVQKIIDRVRDENERGVTSLQRSQQDEGYFSTYRMGSPRIWVGSGLSPSFHSVFKDSHHYGYPSEYDTDDDTWGTSVMISNRALMQYIGDREGKDLRYPHTYSPSTQGIHLYVDGDGNRHSWGTKPDGWTAVDPGQVIGPISAQVADNSSVPDWMGTLSPTTQANAALSELFGIDLLEELIELLGGDWSQLADTIACLGSGPSSGGLTAYCQNYFNSLDSALTFVFNGWKGQEAEAACIHFMKNLADIKENLKAFDERGIRLWFILDAVVKQSDLLKSMFSIAGDVLVPNPSKIATGLGAVLGGTEATMRLIEALVAAEAVPTDYVLLHSFRDLEAYDNPAV